jgi:hypothetical protein
LERRAAGRRRRRRNRRDRDERTPAPVDVVARAAQAKPLLEGKPAEQPLSPEEVAEMKQQLRFLRDHRRVLHLRVNAHEDLLLNGAREPERRGVCQHLLSKVDRARVLAAVERLEPASATRLAEGVLRISPSLDYLLLYLECVRRSASATNAAPALVHALSRIDFTAVSSGQMRRVLDLLVETHGARQLPQILFGLLEGRAFRDAFDASAANLPEALAQIVVPLGAVERVVLRDQPNRFGAQHLARGVRLLLEGDPAALLGYPRRVQRRLVELGVAAGAARDAPSSASLAALFERATGEEREALGLDLAREWIAAGRENDARRLLRQLDTKRARRWTETLDLPRRGRFALIDKAQGERMPAVLLDTMQRATLFTGAASLGLQVPGVAPLVGSGTAEDGTYWFALARAGLPLSTLVGRRHGPSRDVLLGACAEATRLLATLAGLGIRLPDASLERFELDRGERLWLADPTGTTRGEPSEVDRAHAALVVAFCREALATTLAPSDVFERLEHVETASDGAAMLGAYSVR